MSGQLRRTMLYVPGNQPGMVKDAGVYDADCILFDLEDSVSPAEKDSARLLIWETLNTLDYPGKELVVRINGLDSQWGQADLEMAVRTGKAVVRLPKTESAGDIRQCDGAIGRIEADAGLEPGSTRMMAAVESAAGVLAAREIAAASPRLAAIALGAEDYVTDLHTTRSPGGVELLFGRSMVLLAARAAGIDAIDTVFSDVNDEMGFREEVQLIKQLGFDGKSVINPRQIRPVHQIYTPTPTEIEQALEVMEAIEEAYSKGSGVISLHGKMIDRPIVLRAERVLCLARAVGILKEGVQG